MAEYKTEIRPKADDGTYPDIIYPKTTVDMVVDEKTGQTVAELLVPSGGIIMWSGSYNEIPNGWLLCDGTNGTPDLRDRFILGATNEGDIGETGGQHKVTLTESEMPSHSHSGSTSIDGSHRHEIAYDYSEVSSGSSRVSYLQSDFVDLNKYILKYRDSYMRSKGNHSHTLNIDSTGGGQPHENRPAFYKLAFIMKE